MDFVRQAINNIAQTAKKKFNDNEGFFQQGKFTTQPIKQAVSSPANISYTAQRLGLTPDFTQGMNRQQFTNIYNQGTSQIMNQFSKLPRPVQKFGEGFYESNTMGLSDLNVPKSRNLGETATYGAGYVAGMFNPLNPMNKLAGVLKGTKAIGGAMGALENVAGKIIARGGVNKYLGMGVRNLSQGLPYTTAYGLVNSATKKPEEAGKSVATDLGFDALLGMVPVVGSVMVGSGAGKEIKKAGKKALLDVDVKEVRDIGRMIENNFTYKGKMFNPKAKEMVEQSLDRYNVGKKIAYTEDWKKLDVNGKYKKVVEFILDKGRANEIEVLPSSRSYIDEMGNVVRPNRPMQAVDPKNFKSAEEFVKAQQFKKIATENPMTDSYHTGIRDAQDIKTFKETLGDSESFVNPDFTRGMAEKALKDGEITIYGSKPLDKSISQFVTPSKMMASDYAGNGKVYSKKVNINDIAWINGDEGNFVGKSQLTDIWNKANNVASPTDGELKLRNLSGGIAGVEMYQDENGKWQTRYNPVKGIAGVVGMTATSKMGGKDIQDKLNMARQNLQEAMDSRQFKAEMRDMFTGGQRQAIASLQRSMASLERKGSDITNVMNTPSYKKVIYDVMSQIGTDSEDEAIQFIKQYDGKLPNVSVAIDELRNTIKEAKDIERMNPSNYEELIKQDPKMINKLLGGDMPSSITTTKQVERLGLDYITQTTKERPMMTDYKPDSTGTPKFMSSLPIEEDGSAKARLTDVKKAYEEWVNTRRATKLEGALKQKELSELDAKGVEWIMDYQVGKTNTKVKEYFDAKYKELKDAGIEFGYQKDYLPQLWDNTAEEISMAMGRSLDIRPTFSMEKVIKDYKTGIKLGLKPRFQTVGELAGWYERTANKALADNKFFKHLYDDGQILLGDSAPKGWQTISPDRFPKIRVSGELGDYKGTFKAEPETAKLINNYLNDASDETLQKVADYVSKVKNITLNFGIPGTAINSHGVNILARHTLFGTGGNPITRFLTGAKYMINPRSADRYLDTSMQRAPQAIKNGLTLSAEGYEGVGAEALGFKGRFGKKWEQAFGDPLFQKMIPSLKLSSYEELVKNNMDPKDASKLVNTVYGGINWEAMGRDRNMQNWARAIVLAPDWAETTLRIGGNIAKSLNPLNKGMVMNRYRTMGATALGSIVALNVANKISSGHYAYENEPGHTFELESGYTNDGQKRYIRPFGTALDMMRLPFDIAIGLSKGDPSVAVRAFTNRLSIPLSSIAHLAFNIDYKGQKIYGQNKYGNPIEPLQAVGGITSEVGGLTGFPSFAKNLVDSATGKQGIEQGITQALELPFRYTNTGKSALSKQVAPLADLKGKELYDLNASLKGESKLSDNQMEDAMMGAKPIEVVKSIIGDRQANRADKLLDTTQGSDTDSTRMEYGEGGHKNVKALDREIKKIETRVKKGYMSPEAGEIMKQNRMDSYGGSQSDLENYKKEMQAVAPLKTHTENVKQLQAKVPTTQYAMVKKQQEQIALASTIYNNDKLTEEMKTSLLNKLSVSKGDMEYYQIAKDTVDMKQIYVNEQVQSLRNNGAGDQEVYKWLKDNQKEVNGKSIVTATILKQLAGEGQISYAMSGALKKVTTGKVKLRAGRKVKKPKKLGKIKVSYKAPKLTKLKVKIPKLAKIKMLKPEKVKTA